MLHIWGQMTLQEVAEVTGVTLNTAASRYRYGLSKLRERMQPPEDGVKMAMDDKKFEEYLSEFRPREPRALTASDAGFWQRWGARAGDCGSFSVDCGGDTDLDEDSMCEARISARVTAAERSVVAPRESATRDIASEVSLGRLGMLYKRDPAQLDQALAEVSRNLLPHVDRPESTLHSLDHE